MYLCVCHGISDSALAKAHHEGKRSLREIRDHFGQTRCCGRCTECLRDCLSHLAEHEACKAKTATTVPASR